MTTPGFIKKALDGGWAPNLIVDRNTEFVIKPLGESDFKRFVCIHDRDIFLDPKAWQAVGKIEGWLLETLPDSTNLGGRIVGSDEWIINMHGMIDSLCEGKTLEQYLETL